MELTTEKSNIDSLGETLDKRYDATNSKLKFEIDSLKKKIEDTQQIINANLQNQPRTSNGAWEAEKQLNKISFSSSLESKKDTNTKDKICTELISSQVEFNVLTNQSYVLQAFVKATLEFITGRDTFQVLLESSTAIDKTEHRFKCSKEGHKHYTAA